MNKYLTLVNKHTIFVLLAALLSSFISLRFHISLYIDFLIFSLIIAFPLTLTIREAFKRRERAIQYLCLFKSSLQSVFYCFQNSKLEQEKIIQVQKIIGNTSELLFQYLQNRSSDAVEVQKAAEPVLRFIETNRESLKSSFTVKISLFLFRVNESIEFLLATKRHHTPWGVRVIVLIAIYAFAILYPASMLNEKGFELSLLYIFSMCGLKVIILISLYNVQSLLEDPFIQKSPDRIRLDDFQFAVSEKSEFNLTK